MTATAMLMKEIETLPEESVAEALNFIIFLKEKPIEFPKPMQMPTPRKAESMFGAFPGIDTHIEREEDRL